MSDARTKPTPSALPLMDDDVVLRRRAEVGGGSLRGRVAGGTVVNTIFLLVVNGLSIIQGLLLARLLGAKEYGLFGLLAISFGTIFALASVGLNDKYIQQDHEDQEAAFQIAFTLQSILCGLFTLIAFIAVPLFSLLYREPRILLPGLLLAGAMPLIALQTPLWAFYRRMDFVKQRILESVSPIVSAAVTVTLALTGVGFWSFVIGSIAGAVASSITAMLNSPYKVRFRYERGALREYASFSWPLFLGSIAGVISFQVPLTIAARALGSQAIGSITLAGQITAYTRRVDDIVTHALFPAICVVKNRRDLLFESFAKSNRLALLWGFPLGVGAALFARPAVHLVLGSSWTPAVPLIQVLGISAAVDQIGFNWTAFARARGETKFLGVGSVAGLVAMLGVGVPMLLAYGLRGFAFGIAAATLVNLGVRMIYLVRLFPARRIAAHVARSFVPTLPAAAAILGERAALAGSRSPLHPLLETALYVALVVAVSWLMEAALLREAAGYIRQRTRRTDAHAEPATRLA